VALAIRERVDTDTNVTAPPVSHLLLVIPDASAAIITDPVDSNRRLLRTCYLAALSSQKNSPASRTFYDRKRVEGKTHKQALLTLARRRINVVWAMLRDHTLYHESILTALNAV
jgi:hypothetical protein